MNNRKARLLLRVPANQDGHFEGYKVSNRLTLIYRRGRYYKTHCIANRSWRRKEAEARKKRAKFFRERDEDLAAWAKIGIRMDPNQYTGRE